MAAKLTSISDDQYPIYITKKVFDALSPSLLRSKDGAKMWQSVNELKFDRQVYKSSWYWTF